MDDESDDDDSDGGGRKDDDHASIAGAGGSDAGRGRGELADCGDGSADHPFAGGKEPGALEASAFDHPELAEMWFQRVRGGLLDRLTRYIERRSARGHFRSPRDAAVAARFVLETCVYFGRKRHHDPHPEALPDADAVRETVVDLIVQGLAPRD